jgi:uncharacterized repeat protein (TIGR03803 family)
MKLPRLPRLSDAITHANYPIALLRTAVLGALYGVIIIPCTTAYAEADAAPSSAARTSRTVPASTPEAQVSATILQFGQISYPGGATLPLTVTNVGGDTLTVAPSINGHSYTISGSTCTAGVAAGGTCILEVEFAPAAVGYHDDILTLTTNGSTNPTVSLKAIAEGVGVTEAELTLRYPTIASGATEILQLEIHNFGVPGTIFVTTNINGPSYKVLTIPENTCLAGVPPGEVCILPVEFDPVSVGEHDDILALTPDEGVATTIQLKGIASTTEGTPTLPQIDELLYTFTGNGHGTTDGWSPSGGLVMDSRGNLYGTTRWGGDRNFGTVFKLSSTGQETILYSFRDGTDGALPNGGLLIDAQGNLYGTTTSGPQYSCSSPNPCQRAGTVFKVSPEGAETTLATFDWPGNGPQYPSEGLVMDSKGNLYGFTVTGGGPSNCGAVFELTPEGKETMIHSFSGSDGCNPGLFDTHDISSNGGKGLAIDAAGNLYGTTGYGGPGGSGNGVVFRLAPQSDGSWTETILHSFLDTNEQTDGAWPYANMVLDSQGNLYGSTSFGGLFNGGTIFKITPAGAESTLFYNSFFTSWFLQPGLIWDGQNLDGTVSGDQEIPGAVFQLAPSGVVTFLHQFPGQPTPGVSDGAYVQGSLLLGPNGSLYGTTNSDGRYSSGTVFQLSPSVSPVAAPTLSVASGTYSSPQTIIITASTGAKIYYRTDGFIADSHSGSLYQGPVTISSSAVLTVVAVAPDGAASDQIMASYAIVAAP